MRRIALSWDAVTETEAETPQKLKPALIEADKAAFIEASDCDD